MGDDPLYSSRLRRRSTKLFFTVYPGTQVVLSHLHDIPKHIITLFTLSS
jgi:hypothetical protein